MTAQAKMLSRSLVQAVRSVGTERGVDLVLNVLFVRWMTLRDSGRHEWANFLRSSTDGDLLREFMRLAIFRDNEPLGASDSVVLPSALRQVAQLVDGAVEENDLADANLALLATTFDETLEHLGQLSKQSGEADTPRALADLMVALTVRPGDSVLDPACGNGTDLLLAARAQPEVSVSGLDINQRVARRADMRLRIHSVDAGTGFGVSRGDAFDETATHEYDVVLFQPPWGVSFSDSQKIRIAELAQRHAPTQERRTSIKGDMPWLLLALDALRDNGRAAVVLPFSSTFSSNRETYDSLLSRGTIEAIISLPAGLFRHTGINTALWILRAPNKAKSHPSTLMVDGTSLVEATGKGRFQVTSAAREFITSVLDAHRDAQALDVPPHIARVVTLDEIRLVRSLNPQTHLADPPAQSILHPMTDRTLLTQIDLTNFKAFGQPTAVPLAPLTLVYGANSAGKSSVIQSLLLLQQSRAATNLVTQGPVVNVGGFQGVVHGHGGGDVQVGLSYGVLPAWIPPSGTPDPTLPRSARWTFAPNDAGQGTHSRTVLKFGNYQLAFSKKPDAPGTLTLNLNDVTEVFLGLASGTLLYPFDSRHRTDGDEAEQAKWLKGREQNARRALKVLQRDGVGALTVQSPGLLRIGDLEVPYASRVDDREHGIVASYVNRTVRLAAGMSEEVDQLLANLVWLGPLRSAPRRVYDRADTTSSPGDGRHVAIYLFDHTSVVEQVNDWLERLEIPYTLDVIPVTAGNTATLIGDLVAISLTDIRSQVSITPADVGFGISQVLPIVVELLARRESIIAIEQPETHLHPRLQARLADLLIDAAQAGGRGNQLIVETHSEHLMLRVQRRMREGSLDPSMVSVVYVDRDETGQATVQSLRLNEDGDFLDEWPHGFFDERLEEMFGTF